MTKTATPTLKLSCNEIIATVSEIEAKQMGYEGKPPIPALADFQPHFNSGIESLKDGILKAITEAHERKVNEIVGSVKELDPTRLSGKSNPMRTLSCLLEKREKEVKEATVFFTKELQGLVRAASALSMGQARETDIEYMHDVWARYLVIFDDIQHPLAPAIRAWLQENTAKRINNEYDRRHPVAIIDRASMGSIRDVVVPSDIQIEEIGELKGISAPAPETSQLILPGCEVESKLPAVLPLQAVSLNGIETTKRGAVAMPIRLFFEAIMSLDPKETQSVIRFTLGDLLQYLNPDGKYHRTNHLPYVLRSLHSLYFLRIPYRENPDRPSTEVDWIPVLPRSVPNAQSGDDASIILEVKLPPTAKSGMMVEKEILRLTGKQSSPKFNAYLTACWIFDHYGTSPKGIIESTRPVENRDADGYLLQDGSHIRTPRGDKIKNPYNPNAIAQLEREPNPARKRYPILTVDDLVRACYPKGFDSKRRAMYLKRAKKAWTELEKEGIIQIERHALGWRIMPSQSHVGRHRALREKGVY